VAGNDRMPGQPDRWAGHHEPRNHLLEILSPNDWTSVEALLERVDLAASQTVELPGEVSEWLLFPESAIISVVKTLVGHQRIEVGTVGSEGMCGLSGWYEAESDNSHCACSVAGSVLRARASEFIAVADHQPAIRRLLNRYAGAYIALVEQGTACNLLHDLEQRCARWLLMAHDRLCSSQLMLTHEFLAGVLGVPSESASAAIRSLCADGVIRASHRRVDIIERDGLERMSCECYQVMRTHFARLS
jgi:CRP-like cAMP-binding protein